MAVYVAHRNYINYDYNTTRPNINRKSLGVSMGIVNYVSNLKL